MFWLLKIFTTMFKKVSCISQVYKRKTSPVPWVRQASRKKARLEENTSRKGKLCTESLPLVNQVTLKKPRPDVVPLVAPSDQIIALKKELEQSKEGRKEDKEKIIALEKELKLRDEACISQQKSLEQSEEGRMGDKEKIIALEEELKLRNEESISQQKSIREVSVSHQEQVEAKEHVIALLKTSNAKYEGVKALLKTNKAKYARVRIQCEKLSDNNNSLTTEYARKSLDFKELQETHRGCSDINKSLNIDGPHLSPLVENIDQDVVTSKVKNIQAPPLRTYKDLSEEEKMLVEYYLVHVTVHNRTSDNKLLLLLQEKTGLLRSALTSQVCALRYRMIKKLGMEREDFWDEMKKTSKKQIGASEVLVTDVPSVPNVLIMGEILLIAKNTSVSMKKLVDSAPKKLENLFKSFRAGKLLVN